MSVAFVPVFTTSDQALLPLATMALDVEQIEYTVWRPMGLGAAAPLATDTPLTDAGVVVEIHVRREDEARARDVLRDLQQAPSQTPTVRPTIGVHDGVSGVNLGHISPQEAQFLVDHLEEEDAADTRYFIDAATIEMLQDAGAEQTLIHTLRRALGAQDGVEIHVADGRER